jgi:anti-sigma B factor antagonist
VHHEHRVTLKEDSRNGGAADWSKMTDGSDAVGTSFDVAVWQQDCQSAIVVLRGELDLNSAPKLRGCLAELVNAGVINLVFDLAYLTFLDSTGISLFVITFKRSTTSGGSVLVRNAPPHAMRIFEITGLVELLSVSPLELSEDGIAG